MIKRITILCLLIFLFLFNSIHAQQPRFYLSTDKIFSPGENTFITLECRGMKYLDIRVYKIEDPKSFFLAQQDIHQPREQNLHSGTNALKILSSTLDKDKLQFRKLTRKFVNYTLRSNISEKYKNLKKIGLPSKEKILHSRVKILKDYPLLHHFRHSLSKKAKDDWIYEKIPINETTPGAFLIEGVNGEDVGYTMVVISKLALITKQSGDTFLCYTVDKITGQPIPNTSLSILNTTRNKELAAGKTDKNGLFNTPLKNVSQLTVIGKNENQLAIIDPTFFPVSVNHRKVYIYTDRPVYRPSQEVFYKGIVRDFIDENYKTVMSLPVTVRVTDPKGNEVTEKQTTLNRLGTFNGSFLLGNEPPTGTYKVIAEIEGKTHQAEFKIKEYKKPKFKVDVQLEGSAINGSKINAVVTGKYYFGPPVQNAGLKYYVYKTRFYIPWWIDEDYKWYYSEAEYRSTRQELVEQGEGKLDEKGKFFFDFQTKKEDGDFTYRVEVRVKDESNFIVVGQKAIKTSKGQFDIDIHSRKLVYSPNREVKIFFHTHNLNNHPMPAAFDFKAIQNDKKENVIFSKAVETDDSGRAVLTFKPKKNGHIKLVARGIDRFDNVIRSTSTIWVAGKGKKVSYAGEGIEIVANQRTYRPGDKAKFLVLSRTPDIPFLFTVEGGNLYHHKVHRFTGNACLIELPLKPLYSPNIYVTAAAIFDDHYYSRKKNIIIPPVEKLLNVSLKTDKEIYKPGEKVTVDVRVRDHLKRPVQVELSLGVVDESIYAISPELAVVMQKFFYPRKRNNVRTNNSLNFNFYGYSLALKPELASAEIRRESGLSSFKGSLAGKLREKFKDTCFWTPTVMTSRSGRGTVTFHLPENITQWRLTARCVNYYTQLGSAVEKIISRRDLNIIMDPPQSFTEGDRVVLPVSIKNVTSQKMEGDFQFRVRGGEVVSYEKKYSIKPMGTATIPVTLRVTGNENIVLAARVEAGAYSDGIKLTVPVTPYGVRKVLGVTALAAPSETAKTLSFTLPSGAFERFYKGRLYIHSGVYRAILSSLNYLASYPYGCVEQTMSGFLPDVVLAGILEKQNIVNPALKAKTDKFVGQGIGRLFEIQHQTGGWGWWREEQGDAYMTAYVMYGLTLARDLGYAVDSEAFDRGLAVLEKRVGEEIPTDVRVLSLYVLTLADRAPVSIIMDMYERRDVFSPYSLSLLTLTASRAGKTKEAETMAGLLLSKAVRDEGNKTVHWEGDVRYRLITHNLPIETTAFTLQALLETRPQSPEILAAVHWLMARRQGNRWKSTRDTAAVVMALSHYIAGRGIEEREKAGVRFRINRGEWRKIAEKQLYSDSGESFAPIVRTDVKEGDNVVEIEKSGGSELFINLYLSHYSREADTRTRSGPLRIDRQYFRLSSDKNELDAVVIPGGEDEDIVFQPGEEFLVKLEIDASEVYEYMVLEDFIPAGFQVIEKSRGYNFIDSAITDNLAHRFVTFKEVRDNRMVFFFNELGRGNRVVIYYLMRAALEGDYEVNPAVIRSMYFDNRRALSGRFGVTVRESR